VSGDSPFGLDSWFWPERAGRLWCYPGQGVRWLDNAYLAVMVMRKLVNFNCRGMVRFHAVDGGVGFR
jgi:hypothetical protein